MVTNAHSPLQKQLIWHQAQVCCTVRVSCTAAGYDNRRRCARQDCKWVFQHML